MPISALPTDTEAIARGFAGPAFQRRREVLRETIRAVADQGHPDGPSELHRSAALNLQRWRQQAPAADESGQVFVLSGDWGAVTQELTQRFGHCFAVLNMANAYYPGGAYGEGARAQEENMFRRTDCHFQVRPDELAPDGRMYTPAMSRLLQGADGRVYLDAEQPRVCIRGPELRDQGDLGYAWLAKDDVFPFYELRASAQDLRDGSTFNAHDAKRLIEAIFDTLTEAGIRHAVLGALGCGAFQNPAHQVAQLFREALLPRRHDFDAVAFAIYHAGYGPDNFTPFSTVFGDPGS